MPSILMRCMDLSDCLQLGQMNTVCHVTRSEDSHVLPSHGGNSRNCRPVQYLEEYCTRFVVSIASSDGHLTLVREGKHNSMLSRIGYNIHMATRTPKFPVDIPREMDMLFWCSGDVHSSAVGPE